VASDQCLLFGRCCRKSGRLTRRTLVAADRDQQEILGRAWDEAKIIGYAYAYEQATHYRRLPPPR